MLSKVTAVLPGSVAETMVGVLMLRPWPAKPKGTLHFANVTWQKVQIIVETAAKDDAADSSRNG